MLSFYDILTVMLITYLTNTIVVNYNDLYMVVFFIIIKLNFNDFNEFE